MTCAGVERGAKMLGIGWLPAGVAVQSPAARRIPARITSTPAARPTMIRHSVSWSFDMFRVASLSACCRDAVQKFATRALSLQFGSPSRRRPHRHGYRCDSQVDRLEFFSCQASGWQSPTTIRRTQLSAKTPPPEDLKVSPSPGLAMRFPADCLNTLSGPTLTIAQRERALHRSPNTRLAFTPGTRYSQAKKWGKRKRGRRSLRNCTSHPEPTWMSKENYSVATGASA